MMLDIRHGWEAPSRLVITSRPVGHFSYYVDFPRLYRHLEICTHLLEKLLLMFSKEGWKRLTL